MFGGSVGRDVAAADARGHGGDVDNTATALVYKSRREGFADVVDAGQVDGEHAMPELIGIVQELVAAGIAGVNDQDIYSTKALDKGLGHRLHLLRIGYVAWSPQAFGAHSGNR